MKLGDFGLLTDENIDTFTIETIKAILAQDVEVTTPFILVARRKGPAVAIRYRPL